MAIRTSEAMIAGLPSQSRNVPGSRFSPESRAASARTNGRTVPVTRTTDKDGNVHFFQGANEVGEAIGAGQPKTAPRPSADEAHLQARSAEIRATNPGMTPEQATQQAQVEARAKTVATAGAAADDR